MRIERRNFFRAAGFAAAPAPLPGAVDHPCIDDPSLLSVDLAKQLFLTTCCSNPFRTLHASFISRGSMKATLGSLKINLGNMFFSSAPAAITGFGNTLYVKPKDEAQWYKSANEETLLIAYIETLKGAENLEEIVSLPGVDICFVGTSDLSVDLGKPGDYSCAEFRVAVQRIFDAARKHNLVCGLPATDYDTAKYWIEHGVQFFECHSELDLIRAGAARAVEELRKARAEFGPSQVSE